MNTTRSPGYRVSALVVLIAAMAATPAQAASGILSLDAGELRATKLDEIPPWPAETVLSGTNQHWQKVLHKGELVVTVYAAQPALLEISEPYPYDEFVLVLEGEVTLTPVSGDKQTYREGDSFLVPKGWVGTWDMPFAFREMIIVERKAWVAAEE